MTIVQLQRSGTIATITMNKPTSRNALDLEMARMLVDAVDEIASDTSIRAIILRGNGPAFCVGGDIRAFEDNLENLATYIRELLETMHRFLTTLARSPKVSIAAVHGCAAGAGLSLAAMCDMCVAEEDAQFVPAFAKLGLSPDSGGTFGLARAVGIRRALQIFLSEQSVSARIAESWGLVTRLAPTGQAAAEAERLANLIVGCGADAIANTKRLLGRMESLDLDSQLDDEMESILRCMDTDTFREAIAKFLQKQKSD